MWTWISCVFNTSQSICIIPTFPGGGCIVSVKKIEHRFYLPEVDTKFWKENNVEVVILQELNFVIIFKIAGIIFQSFNQNQILKDWQLYCIRIYLNQIEKSLDKRFLTGHFYDIHFISPCDNKSASRWIMFDYFFHVWKVNIFSL